MFVHFISGYESFEVNEFYAHKLWRLIKSTHRREWQQRRKPHNLSETEKRKNENALPRFG